jgi:Lon protease-like protein
MKDDAQKKEEQATPSTLGNLILPDQILPPNLFILPINAPIVFPTLLAPILITHPRFIGMIEEALNRQRMIGLLLTRLRRG